MQKKIFLTLILVSFNLLSSEQANTSCTGPEYVRLIESKERLGSATDFLSILEGLEKKEFYKLVSHSNFQSKKNVKFGAKMTSCSTNSKYILVGLDDKTIKLLDSNLNVCNQFLLEDSSNSVLHLMDNDFFVLLNNKKMAVVDVGSISVKMICRPLDSLPHNLLKLSASKLLMIFPGAVEVFDVEQEDIQRHYNINNRGIFGCCSARTDALNSNQIVYCNNFDVKKVYLESGKEKLIFEKPDEEHSLTCLKVLGDEKLAIGLWDSKVLIIDTKKDQQISKISVANTVDRLGSALPSILLVDTGTGFQFLDIDEKIVFASNLVQSKLKFVTMFDEFLESDNFLTVKNDKDLELYLCSFKNMALGFLKHYASKHLVLDQDYTQNNSDFKMTSSGYKKFKKYLNRLKTSKFRTTCTLL